MRSILNPSINTQQVLLSIVRIITGAFMVYHGWEVFDSVKMDEYAKWDSFKGMNGHLMAYIGKGSEFIGGLLLTIGFFTRGSALLLILIMGYIAFFIGKGKIWYEDQHPFMFVLLGLIYFAQGGGKWSLDKWLEDRRNK